MNEQFFIRNNEYDIFHYKEYSKSIVSLDFSLAKWLTLKLVADTDSIDSIIGESSQRDMALRYDFLSRMHFSKRLLILFDIMIRVSVKNEKKILQFFSQGFQILRNRIPLLDLPLGSLSLLCLGLVCIALAFACIALSCVLHSIASTFIWFAFLANELRSLAKLYKGEVMAVIINSSKFDDMHSDIKGALIKYNFNPEIPFTLSSRLNLSDFCLSTWNFSSRYRKNLIDKCRNWSDCDTSFAFFSKVVELLKVDDLLRFDYASFGPKGLTSFFVSMLQKDKPSLRKLHGKEPQCDDALSTRRVMLQYLSDPQKI